MTHIEKLLDLVISLLESCFGALAEAIETFITGVGKRKHALTANFISERSILSRQHSGFCLTGRRSLSAKDSFSNAIVIGGSGVGKSSIVLLPSLYKMEGSFVVHDPSSELYSKSAAALIERGYDVRILNFAKPDISAGYNPLARAKSSSDIKKVSSMLVANALGKGKSDPFWNNMASTLLGMFITVLKLEAESYHNLHNLRLLLLNLGANPECVDQLFAKHKSAHPQLWTEYKQFNALDEKVRMGTLATCQSALGLLEDYSVAQVTSIDTLPFDMLRKRPTAIFLQTSIADVQHYSVLTTLFLEQCFAYVLSRFPEKNEQDIFFLIDEASSLQFKNLQLSVANIRKHNAGMMLLLQHFGQLVSNYNREEADAIRSNCFAKMYFTGQPYETAKELSELMGQFEYKDEKGNTVTRSLMTPSEIREMHVNQALIICGHNAPIKAKLRPYYKNKTYKAYSQMQAPKPHGANFGTVPVFSLPRPKPDATKK